MNRPATGVITDMSTCLCLPSCLQVLMEENNGLCFLPFLHDVLLSQLVGTFTSASKELGLICRDIA